jgi:lauroyl/myristoyl acyltransferase
VSKSKFCAAELISTIACAKFVFVKGMQRILYWIAHATVALLQALPLKIVALLGRSGGAIAWIFDKRHRMVMLENLRNCFPDKSEKELRGIARENMLRIGENYAAAVKTAILPINRILKICEVSGLEKFGPFDTAGSPKNCIVAIGHFGNFELNANLGKLIRGLRPATTYRGLRQPLINELLQDLREQSGCLFFERRTQSKELIEALGNGGLLLGLLSDQHAGRSGVKVPFFGRECSTTAAPAVFALRYNAPLYTAICYRTALGQWKVEVGNPIPTRLNGETRTTEEITADINAAFEAAVRKDPANWFWVHKRWKIR